MLPQKVHAGSETSSLILEKPLTFPGTTLLSLPKTTTLTGVCSALMTVILCHVALSTVTAVGALNVVAEVRTWGFLTLIYVITQLGVIGTDDITFATLTRVANVLVNTLVCTHLRDGLTLIHICR